MRFSLLIIFIVLNLLMHAQVPALIPYQAVARDAAGQALNNATINARFTIHDGMATGSTVWQELHTVTTTSLGLFTVQLGSNVALTAVNWANGDKFMQVEIDLGQGFVDIGTQQMLSVPYALHAGSVSLNVSSIGDTLFVGDGQFVIVPGISEANSYTSGTTLHTCGAPNVHNPDLTYGSLTDQEGNVYKTIVIGTQEWMAENLNTSIYRNGEAIPTGLSDAEWYGTLNEPLGAWAYYNNDVSYNCPLGKLYNWYTCVDSRALCPLGWHVPSYGEFSILIGFLGGDDVAGGKMKSIGTLEASSGLWNAPNSGASNSSGFSLVSGGFRDAPGFYLDDFGINGYCWSSSEHAESTAELFYVNAYGDNAFQIVDNKPVGFPVRCVRD